MWEQSGTIGWRLAAGLIEIILYLLFITDSNRKRTCVIFRAIVSLWHV